MRIITDNQLDAAMAHIDYMAAKIQEDAEEAQRAHELNPDPRDHHLSFRYARVAMEIRALTKLIRSGIDRSQP